MAIIRTKSNSWLEPRGYHWLWHRAPRNHYPPRNPVNKAYDHWIKVHTTSSSSSFVCQGDMSGCGYWIIWCGYNWLKLAIALVKTFKNKEKTFAINFMTHSHTLHVPRCWKDTLNACIRDRFQHTNLIIWYGWMITMYLELYTLDLNLLWYYENLKAFRVYMYFFSPRKLPLENVKSLT